MSERENIRLDDALRQEDKALNFSDTSLTPEDWRKNTKLVISGGLSAILLLAIGYVIYWQCSQTAAFAGVIVNASGDTQIAQIEKAISTINETAKGLYTFLAPLATAVATYFFSQQQYR